MSETTPANERIYLSAPDVGVEEEQAAVRAIRSGWVAPLGPEVDAFEREIAERVGVSHAVALSSATAAIHLGLLELGVTPGDVVITATMTFVATANPITYLGATPYFIDSDRETGNLNPELLRQALTQLRAENTRVGAIIPVDLLGKTADYDAIGQIAEEFGVPILSDAAESLGASHNSAKAGSWGDVAVVSFNGNKIMTTSGGGMLLTNNGELAGRVRHRATQARDAAVHYEHSVTGYNYRMSNVLAAIGRAQLSRLDDMLQRRRANRERYRTMFATVPGVSIFQGANDQNDNCWLTAIMVDPNTAGWSAADLSAHLEQRHIESRPLWKPMHLQPLFAEAPALVDGSAEYLFTHGLTLPSGSSLTPQQHARIGAAIEDFLTHGQA